VEIGLGIDGAAGNKTDDRKPSEGHGLPFPPSPPSPPWPPPVPAPS
jgi:hypothetical protein